MRSWLFMIVAMSLLPAMASAQAAFSAAGALSNSGSTSESGSAANGGSAGSTLNFNSETIGSNDIPANQTIRNNTQAPDVVISGANACGLPIGASTSIMGFGFGLGATPTDKGCEHRDDAAAMHALGHDDVAIGIMCEQADVAQAMSATGHPCPPVGTPTTAAIEPSQPLPTGDNNTAVNQEISATPPAPIMAGYALQHQEWCRGLSPANPEDVPYIQYDCGGMVN
jgi:hypothetical protein